MVAGYWYGVFVEIAFEFRQFRHTITANKTTTNVAIIVPTTIDSLQMKWAFIIYLRDSRIFLLFSNAHAHMFLTCLSLTENERRMLMARYHQH